MGVWPSFIRYHTENDTAVFTILYSRNLTIFLQCHPFHHSWIFVDVVYWPSCIAHRLMDDEYKTDSFVTMVLENPH